MCIEIGISSIIFVFVYKLPPKTIDRQRQMALGINNNDDDNYMLGQVLEEYGLVQADIEPGMLELCRNEDGKWDMQKIARAARITLTNKELERNGFTPLLIVPITLPKENDDTNNTSSKSKTSKKKLTKADMKAAATFGLSVPEYSIVKEALGPIPIFVNNNKKQHKKRTKEP